MEDSSCSSVAQEAVVVKQEAGAGSCGVSEAGAREGLYSDRELKPEASLEPEVLPDYVTETFMKEETDCVKLDDEGEQSAALAALYAGHEVKDELVLGPEGPQLRDAAFALYAAAQTLGVASGLGKRQAPSLARGGDQLALRDCAVRLERSPTVEALLCIVLQQTTAHAGKESDAEKNSFNDMEIKPEKLNACDICHKSFTLKSHLIEHVAQVHTTASLEQEEGRNDAAGGLGQEPAPSLGRGGGQLALRDCAVRLERIPALETLLGWSLRRGAPEPQATRTTPAANKTEVDKDIHSNTVASTEGEAYSCPICRKRFAQKSSVIEHVAVHIHTPTSPERGENRSVSSVGARPQACGQQPPAPQRHTRRTRTAATHAAHSETTRSHPICTTQDKTSGETKERTLMGMKSHSGEKRYSCEICTKKFGATSSLKRHLLIHTGEKPYSCKICTKQFALLSKLKKHKLVHTNTKPYSCEICTKQFTQSSNLKIHKLTHTNTKPYSCEICTKQFTLSSNLKKHKLVHTNTKPYSCEICTKQFTQSSNLKIHKLTHTNTKPYYCEICTKQFTQLSNLKVHKLIHTKTKPYSCEICTKRFTQLSHLKVHRLIHTNTKPYSCEICKKQFENLSNLKVHKLIHMHPKPYSCDICTKQFTQLGTLKCHKLIHMNPKRYYCEICTKRFTQLVNLKTHKLIHSNIKPYTCKIYLKQYRTSTCLKRHSLVHAGEKPYTCDMCKKQFIWKGDLVHHIRRHLREEKERSARAAV